MSTTSIRPSTTSSLLQSTDLPPLIPITTPPHKRPLYAIPVALCLAALIAIIIALIVLGRKGKLKKLSPFQNPYVRRMKREAQLERVARVEAERTRSGGVPGTVELRVREEGVETQGREGGTEGGERNKKGFFAFLGKTESSR